MQRNDENHDVDLIDFGVASAETQGIGIVQADLPAGQPNLGILDE